MANITKTDPEPSDQAQPVAEITRKNSFWIWVLFFIVLVGVFLGYQFKPCNLFPVKCEILNKNVIGPLLMWRIYIGLIFGFCIILGFAIKDRWSGLFIDERNKMSLSRFQLALWTVLLLSGFLVAVLINLFIERTDSLAVMLDEKLWALMGISSASLVGSGLIKARKAAQPGDTNAKTNLKNAEKAGGDAESAAKADDITSIGRLAAYKTPERASWLDMFTGDESGDAAWVDIGKVQMFIFTLIVWFTYATAIAHMLVAAISPEGIKAFPPLDSGMIALLGISHAAYLGKKTIPAPPAPDPEK